MIDTHENRLKAFQEAADKAASESPESVRTIPGANHLVEDMCLVVSNLLADGDAGWAVFVGGREFAQKLLENIDNPQDYEVCALLPEAIKNSMTMFDTKGIPDKSFRTPECESLMSEVQRQLDSQAA